MLFGMEGKVLLGIPSVGQWLPSHIREGADQPQEVTGMAIRRWTGGNGEAMEAGRGWRMLLLYGLAFVFHMGEKLWKTVIVW